LDSELDNISKKTAEDKFRVLPLASLTAADFASDHDTRLGTRTRPAPLGECDGFASHSWVDDSVATFEKLKGHAWGSAEPTIWLDKVRA
jgi:hypothetical protein